MRQAEHAADDAGDQRRDAQPEEAHRRGEDQRGGGADRHQQEHRDEERAQQVDQREQVLLAVARAEQAEDVGADGVEQADQAERGGAHARRHAAERR